MTEPSAETDIPFLAQRYLRELRLLDQVRNALARELDLQTVFKTVVEAIADAFGYTQVSLYLLKEGVLYLQHQVGYHSVISEIPLGAGIASRTILSRRPILIEDVTMEPDFLGAIDGIVSEVCVPIFDEDEVAGILNVESVNRMRLTQADLRLMTAVTRHVEHAITRARLYTELRQREAQFRLIFERSPVGMAITARRDGRFFQVNKALCTLLGYDEAELLRQWVADVIHPDDLAIAEAGRQSMLTSGDEQFQAELRMRRQDGGIIHVQLQVALIHDAADRPLHFVSHVVDITRQKEAEAALMAHSAQLEAQVANQTEQLAAAQEQLTRKEKLAMLGQLAGSIGHELRNPLGVIANAVYFLQMVLSDADETVKEYLDLIADRTRVAAKIVADLRDLSRQRAADRDWIALPALVAEVLAELEVPENVTLSQIFAPDLAPAFVDSVQMNQVLNNLIINAFQAMPEGGRLQIRGEPAGDRLQLSIQDDGVGMSAETMKDIFEPLFTTKKRGVGLGLAISRSLVVANDGDLLVDSREGEGSTFSLLLPTQPRA